MIVLWWHIYCKLWSTQSESNLTKFTGQEVCLYIDYFSVVLHWCQISGKVLKSFKLQICLQDIKINCYLTVNHKSSFTWSPIGLVQECLSLRSNYIYSDGFNIFAWLFAEIWTFFFMFHVTLPQFAKHYGTFLLPLCLESACKNAQFGGLDDHDPSIPPITGFPALPRTKRRDWAFLCPVIIHVTTRSHLSGKRNWTGQTGNTGEEPEQVVTSF